MREIKSKELQYYCNSIGEIHECGKRMLDRVDELPLLLQRPYQDFWTDEWGLCCYVVFLNKQPGILICAEYDSDYCQEQGIPIEHDAQYAMLFSYGERLEKLAHEINPHTAVGLCYDSACDPQLMLFIPTEQVPLSDIPQLYYLMDQYGYKKAPSTVCWSVQELAAFVKQLRLDPNIEEQMLSSLNADVQLGMSADPASTAFQYMGLEVNRGELYSMTELLNILGRYGGFDSTLDRVRETYTERFGNQLIWKYPFSDNMYGGGAIIPVHEGVLFLPYNSVFKDSGARYQVSDAELLSAENIRMLQRECKAYTEGLLAALDDMSHAVQTRPAKRYVDEQGNLYFVRAGIGNVYKGFRRYAEPKPGQRRESGIRSLKYVKDFGAAQLDLDRYAETHHLKQVVDDKNKLEDGQDD
ncbi:hypothetical protein D7V91_11620 [bacterium 1xD42-67]|nr:hypothetical protein D7V91_11620 [bacterium 1xD42-67]